MAGRLPKLILAAATIFAGGLGHNAFPASALLANGDILVAWRNATDHLSNDGTIYLARSTDGAKTWSAGTQIYAVPGSDIRVNLGMQQLPNGDILLPVFKVTSGTFIGTIILASTDNGATWSVRSSFNGIGTFTRAGPYGRIIVQDAGATILMSGVADNGGNTASAAYLAKSTDSGATWTYQGTIAYDATMAKMYTEVSVVDKGSSNLVAFIRNDNDPYHLWVAFSANNGVTWTGLAQVSPAAPGVAPDAIRLSDGSIVCFSEWRDTSHSIVRGIISTDGGVTTGTPRDIFERDIGFDTGYTSSVILGNYLLLPFYFATAYQVPPSPLGFAGASSVGQIGPWYVESLKAFLS